MVAPALAPSAPSFVSGENDISPGVFDREIITAARHGDTGSLKFLVGLRESDVLDEALITSAYHGHLENVKFLVQKDVDISAKAILAALYTHEEISNFLMRELCRHIKKTKHCKKYPKPKKDNAI